MLKAGKSMRFTPNEIIEYQKIGVDVSNVRGQDDFELAIRNWTEELSITSPSLLEKIARAMEETTGRKLSPDLAAILLPGRE